MSNNNDIWNLVIEKSDIVSVISEHVQISKYGRNFRACCPFHGEKTPSFIVSPEKQIFKCFGCGKSGNAIKFIELYKNISSIEALKILAEKANIDISDYASKYSSENSFSEEQLKLIDVMADASIYFQQRLNKNTSLDLKNFLEKRKLTKDLIKDFEIGFAPEDESIFEYLQQKGHEDFYIATSSVISQNIIKKNFFNNRLMFPIKNKYGNVVAFSGRDIIGTSETKYLNSYETQIFKKSDVLFNYFNAISHTRDSKDIYLVEGQFDVIALHRIGHKNTIGLMGTYLSYNHLSLLRDLCINIFFDNDKAGNEALKKNLAIILYYAKELNLKVSIIQNTFQKDADEVYKEDEGKTLAKIVDAKIDLSQYLINIYCNKEQIKTSSSEKNIQNWKEMFEYAYYMDDNIYLIFKNKIIENKLIAKEIYEELESKYKKPNFPSIKNFSTIVKQKNTHFSHPNQINSTWNTVPNPPNTTNFQPQYDPYNNLVDDNTIVEKLRQNNQKKKNLSKWKNKPLMGRGYDMLAIIKCILSDPSYLEDLKIDEFINFKCEDENQRRKELICYAVESQKKQKPLDQIIKDDDQIDTVSKTIYLNILDEIKDIDTVLTKPEFDKIVKNMISEPNSSPKELIKLTKEDTNAKN
ncbi:DNA primase [Metamycoplasma hyosynoviae]|uniref:DNA primase n=1 Tax=Metamycoplasma hyosynoviae TaxID=29559 RepID=UPI0023584423|nr:DNA primase [Metamycoplasma hyosynoviae]MDC8916110.1 DNA primase [Metamycoplasma hyosynoviae]MDD1377705.1 DNA primase [Metamycoplasma hyosynoviae]